jgi:hypothetical protein
VRCIKQYNSADGRNARAPSCTYRRCIYCCSYSQNTVLQPADSGEHDACTNQISQDAVPTEQHTAELEDETDLDDDHHHVLAQAKTSRQSNRRAAATAAAKMRNANLKRPANYQAMQQPATKLQKAPRAAACQKQSAAAASAAVAKSDVINLDAQIAALQRQRSAAAALIGNLSDDDF